MRYEENANTVILVAGPRPVFRMEYMNIKETGSVRHISLVSSGRGQWSVVAIDINKCARRALIKLSTEGQSRSRTFQHGVDDTHDIRLYRKKAFVFAEHL